MAAKRHPFSGSLGQRRRDAIMRDTFADQNGQCAMCQSPVDPTLRGKVDPRSAVLDHIRPHNLRPDLALDVGNLWMVCKACHDGPCASIEARLWPNADAIADAKRAHREFDGWLDAR